MPWTFRFPTTDGGEPAVVALDGMPWRAFHDLSKKHSDVAQSWIVWKDHPLAIAASDLPAFEDLRQAAAAHAGITVAPLGDSAADAERAMFELAQVDDDLPSRWADGFPPTGSPATE